MKRILFITPPYHAGVVEVAGRWIPLQFVYLGGAAKSVGFDAHIYDAMTKQVTVEDIEARIREIKPDYVATSAITCTFPDALEVMKAAKRVNPAITTLMGSIHATFMADEVFEVGQGAVDFVVAGEGEETLKEFLSAHSAGESVENIPGLVFPKNGSLFRTPPRRFMDNFDRLPMAWDLLEWDDYTYFIFPGSRLGAVCTSRGCSKGCTFCSQQKFWHQMWRPRDPLAIVDEIETLKKDYGVNVVLFTDDYPTQDRERWERFIDLMIERDLGVYILMETRVEDIIRDADILPRYRKAGIVHIYVGIEATDQATLELMKKEISVEQSLEALRLLNEHGIITETSMILGFPGETHESIRRTLDLAKVYNPDFAHFLAITPWPYADMYKDLEPYIVTKDYRKYNLIDPVVKPTAMTTQEIDQAIVDCYKEFYMDKFREMKLSDDPFKRDYLLTSMKLIMNNSFLKKKMGDLGTAPPEMLAAMNTAPKGHREIRAGATVQECPFHNFFKKPAAAMRRIFSKAQATK